MGRASLAVRYSTYTLEQLDRARSYYMGILQTRRAAERRRRARNYLKAIDRELAARGLQPHTRRDP